MKLLGLDLATHPEVYEPAEDTLLLARHVDAAPGERCLEVGTGTGLVALTMAQAEARVVATDVSPIAAALARANAQRNALHIDVVRTDLAAGLAGPFELVACNPPYLPTGEDERVHGPLNRAFDGGLDGAGVARRVLDQLPELLAPAEQGGRALLLASTLQPLADLAARARDQGLTWQEVEREPHGFEALVCVRLTRPSGA